MCVACGGRQYIIMPFSLADCSIGIEWCDVQLSSSKKTGPVSRRLLTADMKTLSNHSEKLVSSIHPDFDMENNIFDGASSIHLWRKFLPLYMMNGDAMNILEGDRTICELKVYLYLLPILPQGL
jgi:hypothetical protein